MKKMTILVLVVVISFFIMASLLLAKEDFDLQTIKKAVKKNPQYKAGKEVKWLKVLIADRQDKSEKVRVTLPISLVELLMNCTKDKELKIDCDDYGLDLKKLFKELKKAGPMSLIEICGEEATLKIWLE